MIMLAEMGNYVWMVGGQDIERGNIDQQQLKLC